MDSVHHGIPIFTSVYYQFSNFLPCSQFQIHSNTNFISSLWSLTKFIHLLREKEKKKRVFFLLGTGLGSRTIRVTETRSSPYGAYILTGEIREQALTLLMITQ